MGKTRKMRKISSVRGRRRDRNVVMPPPLRYRSTSSSPGGRGKKRVLMRPWLEGLLNREECSILHWENRERRTFSIAWRHASSHGFDQYQHGDLFYMWGHHTGKLTKSNRGNHSNNKSTFRCALHSLKDCIELTKSGEKRGEGAKRTYQFIDSDHHLYNKKRKGASKKKGNKSPHVDENSACSLELKNSSANEMDYFSTETNSPQPPVSPVAAPFYLVYATPSSVSSVQESTTLDSTFTNSNDFKVPSPLTSTSLPIITTSQRLGNSYPNDITDQEQYDPNFPNFVTTDAHEGSQHYSETEPNGDIISLNYPSYCDENTCSFTSCKEEPLTLDNQYEDLKTVDQQEPYETTTSIFIPNMNCGGIVKVTRNNTENLTEHIDCSLIQALLEQPPYYIPQRISPDMDNENSVEITSDVPIENAELILEQISTTEDSYFKNNQTIDQAKRVLTELQPMLNDQSLAAMEEESNFDALTGDFDHIFSGGVF